MSTITPSEIVYLCQRHFLQYDIAAIYLDGSRMRQQNRPDSDYDVTMIVNPSVRSLAYHQRLISKQIPFEEDTAAGMLVFDCKIYEKAQLARLINKCNPNLTEQFLYQPLFVKKEAANQQLFKTLKGLNPFEIDPIKAFNAFRGMLYQEENKTNRTAAKRARNIQNYLTLLHTYLAPYLTANIKLDDTQTAETQLQIWQEQVLPQVTAKPATIAKIDRAFITDFIAFCHQLH